MNICEFEHATLTKIATGNRPDDPGAAWWAACEALLGRGLIKAGEITDKGKDALAAFPAYTGKDCDGCGRNRVELAIFDPQDREICEKCGKVQGRDLHVPPDW